MSKIKFKSGSSTVTYCPWRVGDLLFSATATNPNVEWPGTTWSLYAQDRFPVGAGTSYALGATGGAASVTLTLAQIPSHDHNTTANDGSRVGWGSGSSNTGLWWDSHLSNVWGSNTSKVGGGGSHENRPPYIAVNIWRRTA